MATVAATERPAKTASRLPGRKFDHIFFSTIAVLMLITVFVGFGPSYYLAGTIHAPLPSRIIHVHAIAFSLWMVLLITQTTLTSAGRVDLHRRLGIAGVVLAAAMVILGVMAATDSLVRAGGPPGRDVKFFYIVPLTQVLMFGTLMIFAFRARFDPATHKRLVLAASTALMVAAIARWPFVMVNRKVAIDTLISYTFLLLLAAYDLWSTRKVHRATLWASAFIVFVSQVRMPIGQSNAWHAFATWVQQMAR